MGSAGTPKRSYFRQHSDSTAHCQSNVDRLIQAALDASFGVGDHPTWPSRSCSAPSPQSQISVPVLISNLRLPARA